MSPASRPNDGTGWLTECEPATWSDERGVLPRFVSIAALVCLTMSAVAIGAPVDAATVVDERTDTAAVAHLDRSDTDLTAATATPQGDESATAQMDGRIELGDAPVDPGENASIPLVLGEAPAGLAGFEVTVSVADEHVASIESAAYPDTLAMTERPMVSTDGRSITLEAVDLENEITAGAADVTLATIEVSGNEVGTTAVRVTDARLDADGGTPIAVEPTAGTITVGDGTGESSSPGGGDADGIGSTVNEKLPGFGGVAALVALGWVGWRRRVRPT
ncbi:hypothetical protein C479_02226 [Halovivax asiaticus JCM 14624]|uniref:PGF-CTERM sorting domain-containing protein n=1 Tax=Halovivax asiaticus JCM 14624 TaxID=1227490 RepID=M0BVE3_9EURY|nr:hypothetical protein [Halovivax asiaticus]ELZ13624.1 hypothetical protein C479_02226 [Halovivax asiaticus JCM 14624]